MKLPASTTFAILATIGCGETVACRGTLDRALHRRVGPEHQAGSETDTSQRTPTTTPATAPALRIVRAEGSFRPPPAPKLPVKQGSAPLAYLVETEATIRVADLDSGATLAQALAPARSIVRIDQSAGVRIGSALLLPGPLAAGRKYGIYLEENGENLMRTEHVSPTRAQ